MATRLVFNCKHCKEIIFISKKSGYDLGEDVNSENTICPQGHSKGDVLECKSCGHYEFTKLELNNPSSWEVVAMGDIKKKAVNDVQSEWVDEE